MAVSLAEVRFGTSAAPPRILVYGIEGVGKSTFAARFPKPVFIQTEDGLDNMPRLVAALTRTVRK